MNFEQQLMNNMRVETPSLFGPDSLTRSDVDRYHLHKLQTALHYAIRNSSFYHELFAKTGVTPEDIHTLADIEKIPLTKPEQVAATPFRFLCRSQSGITRIHNFVTSGTVGPRKKIFWTQTDLDRIVRFMAAGISTVARVGDVVNVWLPTSVPYGQSDLLVRGVKEIGARPVVVPMDISSEDHLRLIADSRATVIFGFTHRIVRLTRELERSHDLSRLGMHALFLTSEYLPDRTRADLQKTWNCRVSTHYGLTEMGLGVAVECEAGDGYHYNETDLLAEIVDPETGRSVVPGDEGELVFTTLTREAMPLFRYRTRDFSRLISGQCLCGAKAIGKFAAVKKRIGNVTHLSGGDEIYPSLFDCVLLDMPGFVDYRVAFGRLNDREYLRFRVELNPADREKIPEIRRRLLTLPALAKSIRSGTMAEPLIEIVAPGGLFDVGVQKMRIDVEN